MRFVIATVEYWTHHGFDCLEWRQSIDGTKTIVHLRYAQTLIKDIENDVNVKVYECPSDELNEVLNSAEWCIK